MRAFVVLGLVFSTPSQESGLGKCHRNDPFCVEWDVKPQLNQSIVAHVLYWPTASVVSADPRGPRPLSVRLLHVGWNCRLEERCLPVSATSSLCWSAVAAGKQEFLSQQVTDMGRFCLVLSVSILNIVHRRALVHTVHLVSGSTLTAAGRFQLLARWPGTQSPILYGIQRAAQTVLGIYLKRACSRVTSASSALGVLNDYALYKSTHSLTHSDAPSLTKRSFPRNRCMWLVLSVSILNVVHRRAAAMRHVAAINVRARCNILVMLLLLASQCDFLLRLAASYTRLVAVTSCISVAMLVDRTGAQFTKYLTIYRKIVVSLS